MHSTVGNTQVSTGPYSYLESITISHVPTFHGRNHLSHESHDSLQQTVRSSVSFDVRDFKHRNSRRRSESLDQSEHRTSLASLTHQQSSAHHSPRHLNNNNQPLRRHRRNLSMEPQQLSRDLAAAVDELNLISIGKKSHLTPTRKATHPVDQAHDYAEIYTPSLEKQPAWTKDVQAPSDVSSPFTVESSADAASPGLRAPTPPLHRFPSWEAKIYQVANDGLTSSENRSSSQEADESGNSMENSSGDGIDSSRAQRTASGGYCDINVPVYATVKGVSCHSMAHPARRIRSLIAFRAFTASITNSYDTIQRFERRFQRRGGSSCDRHMHRVHGEFPAFHLH